MRAYRHSVYSHINVWRINCIWHLPELCGWGAWVSLFATICVWASDYCWCKTGRHFLFLLWSNFWQNLCMVGELQDPAAARLIFMTVAALGAELCCQKLSGSLPQWADSGFTYFFFAVDSPTYASGANNASITESTVLTNVTVQVSSSHIVWFSRYNCISAFIQA